MNLSALSGLLRHQALRDFSRDALLALEPEAAHKASLAALKLGLVPRASSSAPVLETHLAGLRLPNPLGMAAGFDKNAEVAQPLLDVGFGFVEVGTVTPRPQPGNPAPRIFRLREHQGVINRLGFNNQGHETASARLRRERPKGIVGVNIGANKDSEDFVADYVAGVKAFADIAKYLTVNISSPNTPGLRGLQAADALARLLDAVLDARGRSGHMPPVFLKLAPDLDLAQMDAIAKVVAISGVDGLIISNTTIARPGVEDAQNAKEAGGLSGAPLFALSTQRLAQMRQRVGDELPIIGVGGVHSAQTALAKFEAGANAVQLYTGLIYEGMGLIADITRAINAHMRSKGFQSVSQLTGTKVSQWARGQQPLPDEVS